MSGRIARLLLVVVALASAGALAAGDAAARTTFFDFCKTVAPHATLTLGPGVPSVQAVSNGGSYGGGLCPRFVTDIVVPTNSSGGPGYFDEFWVGGGYADVATGPPLSLPLSQADCGAYVGYLRVYRRLNFIDSEFTVLGGGRTTGSWVQGGPPFGPHCTLVKDAGYVELPSYSPPWFVGVTYRVAVGAKVGAPWKQVRASAFHVPIIT
jgi:hypothetical protein